MARGGKTPNYARRRALGSGCGVGLGSDGHRWQRSHRWPVNFPVILSHEFAGMVVEVGATQTDSRSLPGRERNGCDFRSRFTDDTTGPLQHGRFQARFRLRCRRCDDSLGPRSVKMPSLPAGLRFVRCGRFNAAVPRLIASGKLEVDTLIGGIWPLRSDIPHSRRCIVSTS